MNKKFIPVILINYNNTHDTEECIESIYKSEGVQPFVIVVDNASKDRDAVLSLKDKFPQIHLIFNEENVGFGRANNVGIKWSLENIKSEYLLLLNNDTIIESTSIKHLVHSFTISSSIGVTTGKIMFNHNRNLVWYGGGNINIKRGWPKIIDFKAEATVEGANKARYVTFASGCLMMFNRNCIEKIKGFDEDFFMYGEDLEICLRLAKSNIKIYYNPECVIYHKVQGSIKTEDKDVIGMNIKNPKLPFLFYHMKSNQWLAMMRNTNIIQFAKFNLYFWTEFFLITVIFAMRGRIEIISIALKTIKRIAKYV